MKYFITNIGSKKGKKLIDMMEIAEEEERTEKR
jgi:hypothetical protein